MTKTAIDAVAQLDSARTRQQLVPLADALDGRPGSDARELPRRESDPDPTTVTRALALL